MAFPATYSSHLGQNSRYFPRPTNLEAHPREQLIEGDQPIAEHSGQTRRRGRRPRARVSPSHRAIGKGSTTRWRCSERPCKAEWSISPMPSPCARFSRKLEKSTISSFPEMRSHIAPFRKLSIADAQASMASKFWGQYAAVKAAQMAHAGSVVLFSGVAARSMQRLRRSAKPSLWNLRRCAST